MSRLAPSSRFAAHAERDRATERRIIREHYGLTREVTEAEREAELASLYRKHTMGSLDDMDESLAARLGVI